MKILLISFSIISTFITDVISEGVCENSNLTINLINTIFGTKNEGFSMKCDYGFTGSYNLSLWSIERDIGGTPDIVYTYYTGTTPPTSNPGKNYVDRQIKFENNNTIVFGSMYLNDSGTYRCTVKFNEETAVCTESAFLKVIAKPVISYQKHDLLRGKEETIKVTGADFLTNNLTTTQFILNINSNNETLQTTISNQTDGFQMFNSSIQVTINEETVTVSVFMVVGDSSVVVDETTLTTTVAPDPTPYLVTVVIMEIWVVIFIIVLVVLVLCVDKKCCGRIIRWILFIGSITVEVFGLIFVIFISVQACKPLESIAIAVIVLSALAIPLGIGGLVLTFKWKSENNNWMCRNSTQENNRLL